MVCGDHTGFVPFGSVHGRFFAIDPVIKIFSDVGDVIADPFQVFGDEQQMDAGTDVAGGFDHVGQEFAKHAVIEGVQGFVTLPDRHGEFGFFLDPGLTHVFQLFQYHGSHDPQPTRRSGEGVLCQDRDPFANVLAEIAHPLQLGGGFLDGDDPTQIVRQRAAQGENFDGILFDGQVQIVHLGIPLDHFLGEVGVEAGDCGDGIQNHAMHQLELADEQFIQTVEFLVKRGHGVGLETFGHGGESCLWRGL